MAGTRHKNMAKEASATAQVDEDGRLYLPAQTRKALNIHGKAATVDLDVRVLEVEDGDGE